MTAPARTLDDLMPDARALAAWDETIPGRNRLMRELRIGADKANEVRAQLIDELAPNDPWRYAEPIDTDGPDPAGTHPEPGSEPSPAPILTEIEEPTPTAEPMPVPAAPVPNPGTLGQLLRIRWGVRLVLVLGVAASIAGNVLHADDRLISRIISAWSPLALLLTIELISRVPVHRRSLAVARWTATAVIAGIAAWVSYWHMASVASTYGESGGSQYLIPLSVDGLVVVASVCLVELGRAIRERQVLR